MSWLYSPSRHLEGIHDGIDILVRFREEGSGCAALTGCTATGTYDGDENHSGSSNSATVTITKATQAINYSNLTVNATAPGGPVTFSSGWPSILRHSADQRKAGPGPQAGFAKRVQMKALPLGEDKACRQGLQRSMVAYNSAREPGSLRKGRWFSLTSSSTMDSLNRLSAATDL